MPDLPVVIFLTGPTATGKTDLACRLLERGSYELVSVDSALVYRGMDIGTAKPSAEVLEQYPHRLIDIRDPSDPYSAADFCRDAQMAIDDITSSGRTPILVGGTMLYFRALLDGLADMPAADSEVRAGISSIADEQGWPEVHRQLAAVDPLSARDIHPNHSQRLSRALEVFLISGITMSEWRRRQQAAATAGFAGHFQVRQIGLMPEDRDMLHRRIETRLHSMLELGFIDEVRGLRARGDLHAELPAIRAVGYRQVWELLGGEIDYETMVERALAATRQLAKRQMTWMRGWPELHLVAMDRSGNSIAPASPDRVFDEVLNFLDGAPM